jgi:hypothetical protein
VTICKLHKIGVVVVSGAIVVVVVVVVVTVVVGVDRLLQNCALKLNNAQILLDAINPLFTYLHVMFWNQRMADSPDEASSAEKTHSLPPTILAK